MSLLSSQHQVWCNEIRNMEMSILKAVGFNLYAILQEHAHSYLLSILRSLKIDTMEKENQKLVAGAWTFLNDAWYFNETSPGVVAAAALLSSSQQREHHCWGQMQSSRADSLSQVRLRELWSI